MFSSNVANVIESIMECVHNLDGNYTELEYLKVAHHIKWLEEDDLEEIKNLPHPEDYEDENEDS